MSKENALVFLSSRAGLSLTAAIGAWVCGVACRAGSRVLWRGCQRDGMEASQ